jgi:zinc finger SWIM domain-containing protein 3
LSKKIELDEFQEWLSEAQHRQIADPNFIFTVLEKDGIVQALFWSDSEMQKNMKLHGESFIFDPTYGVGCGNKPIGDFIGLNGENVSVCFGNCVISDETEETFTWVLQQYKLLLEILGVTLKLIITDGDKAIGLSVKAVFPDVCHKLCVWHLQRNLLKNLRNVLQWYVSSEYQLFSCI